MELLALYVITTLASVFSVASVIGCALIYKDKKEQDACIARILDKSETTLEEVEEIGNKLQSLKESMSCWN